MERLRSLHPDASEPAKRLPRDQLPPPLKLSKRQLRKTAKKMYETSALGPGVMAAFHLRFLLRDVPHDRVAHAGENIVLISFQIAADERLFPKVAKLFAPARLIAMQKPPKPLKPLEYGQFTLAPSFDGPPPQWSSL